MQPSDVLRIVSQYLRHPRDTRRQIEYWLRTRHPQYGYSNGMVLFGACVGFLAFLFGTYCWAVGDYRLLLIPAGMVVVRVVVAVISWGWGKLHSPARKFKKYQRR